MRLSKELHKICPECGAEAEAKPDNKDSLLEIGWASAAAWGKRIHISRAKFGSYLVDLGYLAVSPTASQTVSPAGANRQYGRKSLMLPEKGRLHSATTNNLFKGTLLWDYETFVDVMRHRAQLADVSFRCPGCGGNLEESPDFDYLQKIHYCPECGHVSDFFNAKVVFDR